jgi:hypothetical protein
MNAQQIISTLRADKKVSFEMLGKKIVVLETAKKQLEADVQFDWFEGKKDFKDLAKNCDL